MDGKSAITRKEMFGGTHSIQTNKRFDCFALLARTWATELPCRLT